MKKGTFTSIACLLVAVAGLSMSSCRHMADVLLPKSIAADVVQQASEPDSWFAYMPERAPGFCLRTNTLVKWQDPRMQLGYWRGVHPEAPHRVLMEARGDTLIIHRNYVWDGCTVGVTHVRDLLATLRHDALYHALKEGADFSRRGVDLAFLRDQRQAGIAGAWFNYACIRLFGGFYNRSHGEKTMLICPDDSALAPSES